MGLNVAANRLHGRIVATVSVRVQHFRGELPGRLGDRPAGLGEWTRAQLGDGRLEPLASITVTVRGRFGGYRFALPRQRDTDE